MNRFGRLETFFLVLGKNWTILVTPKPPYLGSRAERLPEGIFPFGHFSNPRMSVFGQKSSFETHQTIKFGLQSLSLNILGGPSSENLENRLVFRRLFHFWGPALENRFVFRRLFTFWAQLWKTDWFSVSFFTFGAQLWKTDVFSVGFFTFRTQLWKTDLFSVGFFTFGAQLWKTDLFSVGFFTFWGSALENRRRDNAYLRTLMHGFPVGRQSVFPQMGQMQDSCQKSVNYVKTC